MSFCEDCKRNEGYCILFDDILGYENCIFHDKKEEDQ